MDEVQVQRHDVGGRRIAVQRVIERVARAEDDDVAGLRSRGAGDGGVPPVVAMRIVDATRTGLRDDDQFRGRRPRPGDQSRRCNERER